VLALTADPGSQGRVCVESCGQEMSVHPFLRPPLPPTVMFPLRSTWGEGSAQELLLSTGTQRRPLLEFTVPVAASLCWPHLTGVLPGRAHMNPRHNDAYNNGSWREQEGATEGQEWASRYARAVWLLSQSLVPSAPQSPSPDRPGTFFLVVWHLRMA
jgi:hypothetical protein